VIEFLATHADAIIIGSLLVAILRNSYRISRLAWDVQLQRVVSESQSKWISRTSQRVSTLEDAERARKELAK